MTNGVIIALACAAMVFVVHVISVTWFLRGIKSRNDIVMSSLQNLGDELRSDIVRLETSISRVSLKIDNLISDMGELSLSVALLWQKVKSIEQEPQVGPREVGEA